jgi:type IX secretion system PorP/SprF family membrane protein
MKIVWVYILLLMMSGFLTRVRAQQTIQLSQYVFNGLAVNPAYAGYKDDPTLNLSSRLQWVGINGAPRTGIASFDGLTNDVSKNVGVGLIATFDQLGPESMSSVYANYAYRLRLDEPDTRRLCFGIAFGAMQYSLNSAEFAATDAGDGSLATGAQSKLTPDFRFGVYYYSPTVYVGASVFNLLAQPINSLLDHTPLLQPQRTVYLTAGAMLPLLEFIDFKPSFMIKEDFRGPTKVDLAAFLVLNKRVWLGTSYQTGFISWNKNNLQSNLDETDAISAIVQFQINDHFRMGYSFDFTLSKLAGNQNGSHELSLSLSFPGKKPRVVSPRYF